MTIDIDGLDSSLVPATGTPVPGGLSYWQAVETIEAVFNAQNATVISADVNEIATNEHSPVTEFTAAMLMTKTVASHLKARKDGRWKATSKAKGIERAEIECTYFTSLTKPTER